MNNDTDPILDNPEETKRNPLDLSLGKIIPWNLETALVIILIAVAIISRFYNLGERVLSHDEINHVIPSYDFYQGLGYRYDPLSHGPFQFHSIALSFFMFGDNEFSFRLPAALFSIATIIIALLAFRRYLGRVGALAAGLMFLISPYMLFYGRYQRNEAFIVVWGMLTIYSILRYLEKGESWVLVLFTLINAFHFLDKATSYIFAAEELIFLAGYFLDRLTRKAWLTRNLRQLFILAVSAMLILIAISGGLYQVLKPESKVVIGMIILLGILGVVGGIIALISAIKGLGWQGIRSEKSFDLLMLLGTLILPLLAALPVKLAGLNPIDYSTDGIYRALIAIGILTIIAIPVGLWWGRTKWLIHALIFYGIFCVTYSTFFTYMEGIAVGFMGALGYWLEQQAVNRGSQPAYYYGLFQIPIYEFLPAIGALVALCIGWIKRTWVSQSGDPFSPAIQEDSEKPAVPTLALLLFWSITSLLAFTLAGEKMPWLTIHIAMPLILSAGWAIGWLVHKEGEDRPFLLNLKRVGRLSIMVFLAILAILTIRTSIRAAYVNFDYPLEYLVYAHAADGPKILLNQIEDLSQRTTGGKDIVVAYDNNVRYPYWWYLRHYPNRIDFGTEPTNDVKRAAIIVVSDQNYGKIAPIVRDNYIQFDLMRMWWPNQDYWALKWDNIAAERTAEMGQDSGSMSVSEYLVRTWKHISPFFTDPKVRSAIWQIWFNRDYSEYALLKNSTAFTLENWNTGSRMRVYIRKDVASLAWGFKTTQSDVIVIDPYEKVHQTINPDVMIGQAGTASSQFQSPRSIAIAPDGSLYVADSRNHRIQHFTSKGEFINEWGRYGDITSGDAPGGTFNEPWGIVVGPNGNVYVTDTWNYRIQKFSAEGKFLSMWGTNGFAENPLAFYGPRGLAIDKKGNLFVVDTGNKRIVIFDKDDNYLAQFGTPGLGEGQLDEPVGIALDPTGNVYITDTWNQRIQVFSTSEGELSYQFLRSWDVDGWYGQSLENKPFISIGSGNQVFISDPEGCRIIQFSEIGIPVRTWGSCGIEQDKFSLPVGLAVDNLGGLWVSDAGENNRLVHFPATVLFP